MDKDAPQGAVHMPKGGQSATGKVTKPISSTIPLSGWSDIDLSSHRRVIENVFTVDAQPFNDLVTQVWVFIQLHYSTGGKHIPIGLFRYYCMTMWWYRALFLQDTNGNNLTTEQKNFLNFMGTSGEYHIPSHIAQYLSNMGNFQQGGEAFRFRLQPHTLLSRDSDTVAAGWFTNDTHANDQSNWWKYAQLPSPGVYTAYACNEADNVSGGNSQNTLDGIAPDIPGATAVPTDNIVGWSNMHQKACHSSWRSTYFNLGWSGTGLPPDLETQFNLSTSTLKWMSGRLSVMKDLKVHSSKHLTLSPHGHPLQAYYLWQDVPHHATDLRPPAAHAVGNVLRATHQYEVALASRFSMDPKILGPAFSFGYRLERRRIFRDIHNEQPRTCSNSCFQPWLFVDSDNQYTTVDESWFNDMNLPLNFGSGTFLSVVRFRTNSLLRSNALSAALVPSDVRKLPVSQDPIS
ncbi:uncharacterized protein LY79DRAFT_277250 [Colletotrichum navitas]|uniref:Uncharacterized protein n=1 Tax=Colletotrichum navitas TaxID=681940 RepID=A0AAD8PVK6_9PEZI|nr:uncharacterized protein LY79DRAFT_277250 [Colletotrichum navitas]KAK1585016.1 hypothetical protein LY79DRAFT_277250 [Colletotrichum navitas]